MTIRASRTQPLTHGAKSREARVFLAYKYIESDARIPRKILNRHFLDPSYSRLTFVLCSTLCVCVCVGISTRVTSAILRALMRIACLRFVYWKQARVGIEAVDVVNCQLIFFFLFFKCRGAFNSWPGIGRTSVFIVKPDYRLYRHYVFTPARSSCSGCCKIRERTIRAKLKLQKFLRAVGALRNFRSKNTTTRYSIDTTLTSSTRRFSPAYIRERSLLLAEKLACIL